MEGEKPGGVVTPEGFDAERQRGAPRDLTASGRQIDLVTLDQQDGGEKPGGVVTPEGFEPSIFALKGRRANRCTTGSLLGGNGRVAKFTAAKRQAEGPVDRSTRSHLDWAILAPINEYYAALGRLLVSARARAASA